MAKHEYTYLTGQPTAYVGNHEVYLTGPTKWPDLLKEKALEALSNIILDLKIRKGDAISISLDEGAERMHGGVISLAVYNDSTADFLTYLEIPGWHAV